jgi:uncharacterized glyoxalase superfamily protein PhnB
MSTEESKQVDRRNPKGPDKLRLKSISPGMTVGDVEVSLPWYRDILGFHVAETWEHEGKVMGASLVAGNSRLMIMQDDWAKGRDRVKGVGIRLHMTTTDDVDALAAKIEERGGVLESPPADMPWGARAFSVRDPDGFGMTISSEA